MSHAMPPQLDAHSSAPCIIGAINQVRTGKTRDATGRDPVNRDSAPTYFWYMVIARAVLGSIALADGLLALHYVCG